MIYLISSAQGNEVAVLRSWGGKITLTHSPSGHWTWCVGREVPRVLAWAAEHGLKWQVFAFDSAWESLTEGLR